MISNTDSILFIYAEEHIRVKVYSAATWPLRVCTSAANTIIVILKRNDASRDAEAGGEAKRKSAGKEASATGIFGCGLPELLGVGAAL